MLDNEEVLEVTEASTMKCCGAISRGRLSLVKRFGCCCSTSEFLFLYCVHIMFSQLPTEPDICSIPTQLFILLLLCPSFPNPLSAMLGWGCSRFKTWKQFDWLSDCNNSFKSTGQAFCRAKVLLNQHRARGSRSIRKDGRLNDGSSIDHLLPASLFHLLLPLAGALTCRCSTITACSSHASHALSRTNEGRISKICRVERNDCLSRQPEDAGAVRDTHP